MVLVRWVRQSLIYWSSVMVQGLRSLSVSEKIAVSVGRGIGGCFLGMGEGLVLHVDV